MRIYFKIFNFLKKYSSIFLLLIFIIVIQNFINFISILFFGIIIGFITKNSFNLNSLDFLKSFSIDLNTMQLNSVILYFAIAVLLLSIINLFINYYSLKIKFYITKDYLSKNLNSIFNANFNFFNKIDKGLLINSFTKEIDKIGSAIVSVSRIIPAFFQCFIFILIPLYINFHIAIFIYLILALISLPIIPMTKIGKKYGNLNTITANTYIRLLADLFTHKTFIIAQNKQTLMIDKVIDSYKVNSNFAIKSSLLDSSPQIILPASTVLTIVLIFNYFGILSSNNLVDFSMILFSLFRFLPLISSIYGNHLKLYTFEQSFTQLQNILNNSNNYKLNGGDLNIDKINDLNLIDIEYFDDQNNTILDKLNFKFTKGKINLIQGSSGSGKSTILHLITRYKNPTRGKIYVNNIELSDINLGLYRDKISYLGQETVIFNTTIRANLTWYDNLNIKDINIINLIKELGLSTLIKNDDFLNTEINDMSETISGGEKQRIAIARALLSNPDLIILDEVTSALDKENSILILNYMKKVAREKIVIAVSHDIEWINSDLNNFYVKKVT